MISLYDLARMAGLNACTVHKDLQRELFYATWGIIRKKTARGKNHASVGWIVSKREAQKYLEYRRSIVGFRSDGKLPTKEVLRMLESGKSVEEVAKEARIKPASVLRVKLRAESLKKRRESWQALDSARIAGNSRAKI